MSEVERLRRQVGALFKANGFNLNKDAIATMVEVVENKDKDMRIKWIETVSATLRKQQLSSCVVTQEQIHEVIAQISKRSNQTTECPFKVYDAFSIRKYVYDTEYKKILPSKDQPQIVPTSVEKASESFRQRFELVMQRAKRNKNLEKIRTRCHTIDSLVGTTKKVDNVIIIAMLTQQRNDCYHLEDLTGSVQVEFALEKDLKGALFFEGGIYMFEGTFDVNLFIITGAALVPSESAEGTRAFFGNENWFGGEDTVAFRANKKLRDGEDIEAFMVILSDVHLDDPKVMKQLYHMFSGYATFPPIAFIFCGNFCSQPRQKETMHLLENGFRRLANQLSESDFHKAFQATQFVFVPGPDDPALNMLLPRPALPGSLLNIMHNVPNVTFTTNPVRIQYGSKEIVLMRDDLVEKMSKRAINRIKQDEISQVFAKTVLSQAHLSPFPMHVSPVLWEYDYALAMHPLPDLVIVADKFAQFVHEHQGVHVCNPGSFSRSPSAFLAYYPQRNYVELSEVPHD